VNSKVAGEPTGEIPAAVGPSLSSILPRLLGETSVAVFLAEYWEKRHLYSKAAARGWEGRLFSKAAIEDYLARNDIRYPSVNLVRDGRAIPVDAYARKLRIGKYESFDLIDSARVVSEHQGGATVVLQLMQNSFPEAAEIANALSGYFRCRIDVHAFITPPGSQGLSAHYDTASAFLIQIRGRKRWRLHATEFQVPLEEHAFDVPAGIRKAVIDEVVLEAGDVLYLPRGVPHEGIALDDASTHLTGVLFARTWVDILAHALTVAEKDRRVRSSPAGLSAQPTESPDTSGLISEWEKVCESFRAAARALTPGDIGSTRVVEPSTRLGRYARKGLS